MKELIEEYGGSLIIGILGGAVLVILKMVVDVLPL